MTTLLLALLSFGLIIAAVQGIFWSLFHRKMEPMRFPSEEDPEGSHGYWLGRLRVFTITHSILLIIFVSIFCILLW